MGCTVFWQCKIYHWDKSVRLLAMPIHTDFRFIFPVECYFLVHLSRRLKCTIVIMRCPSSIVRPSSVVVNFSHFRLLLWNRWTEFNETWQEARSQRPLPSLCFSGRSEKQDGRPGLWLADTFSTSPLKPLNGIQRNLTGSKISTSFTKFVFFGPIGKTRWPPWTLIGWDIFDFSSKTAERNSTKLDRKQDLNILYHVCVFRADQKNKMAALASDWLRHFRLLFWNRWTEFNETWPETRSERLLQSLCFFRLIGKIRWPPWLLIGLDILDFSSETAERPATKHDRKQDLNVLYQVCVFGRSEKQDGRPGQSIKKVAYCTQVHDMWPFGPLVSYHTIFVWSGFRCIPRRGGGWEVLLCQIVFSMSSARKFIFRYFDVKILIVIRKKIWKKKKS